jgi:tRNA(adenine34) deaminase
MNFSSDKTDDGKNTAVHVRFMEMALAEARKAMSIEEVPVGAVIVYRNEVIARGFNQREQRQEPTAHAEMFAIREAAVSLRHWRLQDTTLYVTLEPCAMCAGAMVLARVATLVFAIRDAKSGACGSLWNIAQDPRLNHRLEVIEGVCGEESRALLRSFFHGQRRKPKYAGPPNSP